LSVRYNRYGGGEMPMSLRIVSLIFLTSCLLVVATQASAMTISVVDAFAGTSPTQHSSSGGVSEAVADLATGHLGALVEGLGVTDAYADVSFGLVFGDTSPGDVITFSLSLHGTFSPGSGGIVNFYSQPGTQGPVTNLAAISCNTFNQTHYGSACYGGTYGNPGAVTSSLTFNVPVDDGTIYFNPLLQTQGGSAAVPFADFLNSADFVIIVPDGTVVAANPVTDTPGTTLFRTVSGTVITTVPEPSTALLFAAGGIAVMVTRGHVATRGRTIDCSRPRSVRSFKRKAMTLISCRRAASTGLLEGF
jgi:hypothetical protein